MCRYFVLICIALSFFTCAYSQSGKEVSGASLEKGVSLLLREERSRRIQHLRYTLHFTIPAAVSAPVPASETLSFDLKEPGIPLQLDFKEAAAAVHGIEVNGHPVPVVHEQEHLVIAPSWLKEGPNSITINFTAGNLSLNRNTDYLYTLLVPDRARTVFPCFDQPDLKAVFDLALTVPAGWKAVANAPLKDSVAGEGLTTFHFAPSDTLSTYLFAFAAGRFNKTTRTMNGGRTVHGYYREIDSSKVALNLDKLFDIQDQALQFMETYTGISYPFQKFDFVSIPYFQYGGMEHTGAILYREASLFLDEGAPLHRQISRSNLLAHETAHMWFGNLVTMRWFNDVWMKEVFANFMADKISNITMPDGDSDLKFVNDHYRRAYSIDRTAGANPIRQPLDNLDQAGSLYGDIIYHKAPIMMRQLERLTGEDALRDGLREYLRRYAYGNASWPDLIGILDARTPADLQAWNEVWVNETGRPQLSYSLKTAHGKIRRLTLTQQEEDGSKRIWPQLFEIALVYADRVEGLTVNMNKKTVRLHEAEGKGQPQYIIFNSTGQGYGLFPVDEQSTGRLPRLESALMRASAYINLYENMLNGRGITPARLLELIRNNLAHEPEEINLKTMLDYLQVIYWRFIPAPKRNALAAGLEQDLWNTMQQVSKANEKKLLFDTYAGIAASRAAQDTLFAVWKKQAPPAGVKLSEEDYTHLATGLAIRAYPGYAGILDEQFARIKNPDRQKRFVFVRPALSDTTAVRDAFFASLAHRENREKESWALTGLSYLHHPLRNDDSEKYLPQSLALLEEIQQTGDIFFPLNWLRANLNGHQTASAAAIVRDFLKAHPGYNPGLKAKILQAADNLFRAVELTGDK